ncbi:MAG: hypothetical protein AB7T19_05655 [Planctomycetota bacterium]
MKGPSILARIIRERLLRSPQLAPGGVATSAPPWQRSYGYASVVDRRSSLPDIDLQRSRDDVHEQSGLARIIRERLLRSPQLAPGGVATSAPPWQRSYSYASVVDRRSSLPDIDLQRSRDDVHESSGPACERTTIFPGAGETTRVRTAEAHRSPCERPFDQSVGA